ncbi:elongation factor G, domain II-domain-containing protein [Jimgerdemannia flammicorona]|uniref:Uncharacterized protein n=2 Tax=Jimgerdemannia flammicorona TaxID=994334 RepID=A0A433Q7J9_9FUNG|nr:elongation factor G, domain II-domain-containing protein [Jimgerdemannia flammicorona]RUS25742.1 hypothetical protein BC938DRAFT_471727 [Jimgerdemannia flammicorona]
MFLFPGTGKLENRSVLYNTSTGAKERVNKLLQMYANDVEEIPFITAGNIGVIVGLKDTRTGNTLVQSSDTTSIKQRLQLARIDVPSPVFFAAVEPASVSDERQLEEALRNLMREDPSLHVRTDEETGQTLVSGMGELHLEIVRDRLLNDFKCNAEMGRMRISYRETVTTPSTATVMYDREVMGKRAKAECSVEVAPLGEELEIVEGAIMEGGNRIVIDIGNIDNDVDASSHPTAQEIHHAMYMGLLAGLSRGALLSFPLAQLHIRAHDLRLFGPDSTSLAISTSVSHAVLQAVKKGSPALLEPMMDVTVEVGEEHLGAVVGDLNGVRRGQIVSLDSSSGVEESVTREDIVVYAPPDATVGRRAGEGLKMKRVVRATVPLSSMVGYSSALRSLTGGSGTFAMRVVEYGEMSKDREKAVVREITGV